MDFNEKLQQLRKQQGLTQEQLASGLFVTRTAVSKWESGKGYPNIDSLKSISALFGVSIDDLLSGEELVSLATNENRTNTRSLFALMLGVLDLLMLAFLFLPLYGRQDADIIRVVSLFARPDANAIAMCIYIALPVLMAGLGLVQMLLHKAESQKWQAAGALTSILLHTFCMFVFVATRQPYATSLLFLLFVIKILLFYKSRRMG